MHTTCMHAGALHLARHRHRGLRAACATHGAQCAWCASQQAAATMPCQCTQTSRGNVCNAFQACAVSKNQHEIMQSCRTHTYGSPSKTSCSIDMQAARQHCIKSVNLNDLTFNAMPRHACSMQQITASGQQPQPAALPEATAGGSAPEPHSSQGPGLLCCSARSSHLSAALPQVFHPQSTA